MRVRGGGARAPSMEHRQNPAVLCTRLVSAVEVFVFFVPVHKGAPIYITPTRHRQQKRMLFLQPPQTLWMTPHPDSGDRKRDRIKGCKSLKPEKLWRSISQDMQSTNTKTERCGRPTASALATA
jgi:hypothetical protein